MWIGATLLAGALTLGLYGMGKGLASGYFGNRYDHAEYGEYEAHERGEYGGRYRRSAMPDFPLFQEECGSCHMAYPAYLLPAQSWQSIMANLEDHFGENAELDDESTSAIESYLVGLSQGVNYRRMSVDHGSNWPTRITELPGFRHEHDEIPSRFIRDNAKVSSLSQCNACHRGAERGYFDEDSVVIPGFGRWDD
jgi:hypothetical protein